MWKYEEQITTDELYHHGILGQKWGIRRYQNKDGSLTPAGRQRYLKANGAYTHAGQKHFAKEFLKAASFWDTNDFQKYVKDSFDKVVSDEEKQKFLKTMDRFLKSDEVADKAYDELMTIAEKYGDKYYDAELKENSSLYNTDRSKAKLREWADTEYGWEKAIQDRPDLEEALHEPDRSINELDTMERDFSSRIFGRYGEQPIMYEEGKPVSINRFLNYTLGDFVIKDWEKKFNK